MITPSRLGARAGAGVSTTRPVRPPRGCSRRRDEYTNSRRAQRELLRHPKLQQSIGSVVAVMLPANIQKAEIKRRSNTLAESVRAALQRGCRPNESRRNCTCSGVRRSSIRRDMAATSGATDGGRHFVAGLVAAAVVRLLPGAAARILASAAATRRSNRARVAALSGVRAVTAGSPAGDGGGRPNRLPAPPCLRRVPRPRQAPALRRRRRGAPALRRPADPARRLARKPNRGRTMIRD